uniref:N(alpha)-acetyltransferase 60, NatF catalytic subunit n=1 Tax=Mus musculus TaxID=10090 RepID=D6RDS3_MOUSE
MTEVVPSSALSEVSLRLLCHDDIDTVKHLCGDWFPIEGFRTLWQRGFETAAHSPVDRKSRGVVTEKATSKLFPLRALPQ